MIYDANLFILHDFLNKKIILYYMSTNIDGSLINTIKKLLGQDTIVSKDKLISKETKQVLDELNGKASKQNLKNVRKVDKLTEELVKTCNKVLLKRENDCQCYDSEKNPESNYKTCLEKNKSKPKCEAYNRCRRIFGNSLTGSEPDYRPADWEDPLVEGTHNCYMYFLNDQKQSLKKKCMKICKDKGKNNSTGKTKKHNGCSNLKPQPGNHAYLNGELKSSKRRVYSCPAMVDKVLKDNTKKSGKKSKIIHWDNLTHHQQFIKKCPDNYYKGVLVVHPGNTYHFYRQDKSGKFSHKQGTLRVEDKDASNNVIYVPHMADMNYSKDDNSGINYTDFCGYMCVPENKHANTHAE